MKIMEQVLLPPRGVRNNNPLNIRRGSDRWQGLRTRQSDPLFWQFSSMPWGLRAAFLVLRSYVSLHGLNTLEQIVWRWAPPRENDTHAYLAYVVSSTGWPARSKVPPMRPGEHFWPRLVAAMAKEECGKRVFECRMITMSQVWCAYRMSLRPGP